MLLIIKLAFLFALTWTCHASSQHSSGDDAVPCDNEALMKVIERLERRVEDAERLERRVEDVEKLEGRVEDVERLERRVEALEAENAEQRSEITELKAAMQQQQRSQQQERPAEESDDYDGNGGNAGGHIPNRIRRASPELTIAFYAAVQTEVHHLGQGQNVPFDNVVTNVGNAYDVHVGAFRAPVAGVYVFSTTIVTYARDKANYAFALNRQPMTAMWANGGDNTGDSTGQTIILQLRAGDDVSVQHTESDHDLHGSGYSVFSGFLLSFTDDGPISIVG